MSMACVGNSIHSNSISKRIAATDEHYLTFSITGSNKLGPVKGPNRL